MVSLHSGICLVLLMNLILLQSHYSAGDETENYKKFLKKQVYKNGTKTDAKITSCKPRHVHISFGNNIGCMKIMWATLLPCECQVLYSTNPSSLNLKAFTKYTYFQQHNKKGLHHLFLADLLDLEMDTTYYYIPVCDGQHTGPFYFHVPPNTTDWVADYLVFGDMGMKTESIKTVVQEAQSEHYTAVFHAGDFAYNFYDKGGRVGDDFMEMIEPAAAFVPYFTSPGNHEIEGGEKFYHYRHRFSMPHCDWPMAMDKMWYSINIGPVHFISYSTEVFFTNERKYVKAQKNWLLQDLELANSQRDVRPWIIAFGHRPMYCSTKIGDDCSLPLSRVRLGLEKIFYEMKVDILLQAHEHNYERLWPLYQGKVTDYTYSNVSSPIQIITGAAGSHYGTDHFVKGDQPRWSAFRVGEPALNSYGRMKVQNRTHIWWEQRSALDHSVIDSLWIIKDEMFYRGANLTYVTPQTGNPFLVGVIGVFVSVVSVSIACFVTRYFLHRCRRKHFEKTWHAPLAQDDDSDEEEEFSQHDNKTSLL